MHASEMRVIEAAGGFDEDIAFERVGDSSGSLPILIGDQTESPWTKAADADWVVAAVDDAVAGWFIEDFGEGVGADGGAESGVIAVEVGELSKHFDEVIGVIRIPDAGAACTMGGNDGHPEFEWVAQQFGVGKCMVDDRK